MRLAAVLMVAVSGCVPQGLGFSAAGIGAACAIDSDCAPGLLCYGGFPGGLCTKPCAHDVDCGAQARCSGSLCHSTCGVTADCARSAPWWCTAAGLCDVSGPGAGPRPDAAPPDLPAIDLGIPDAAPVDLPIAPADRFLADLVADFTAGPDLTPRIDLATPLDLAMAVDFARPDFSVAPDLASTPDLVAAPDLAGTSWNALLARNDLQLAAGGALSLIAGDWNGDGNTDFAVLYANSVAMLPGDGKGGAGAAVVTAVCPAAGTEDASSLAAGDWNRDGKLNLAVGCNVRISANGAPGPAYAQYLAGHGDFTFAAPSASALSGTNGHAGVVAGDWNGDGKLDLGVAASNPFINNHFYDLAGNGDGTFQAPTSWRISDGGGAIMHPLAILALDWTGDGKLDVAFTIAGGGFGCALPGGGDGTFGQLSEFQDTSSQSLAAGDWNGDGKIDFASTYYAINFAAVAVSLNKGGGVITDGLVTQAPNGAGSGANAIVALDVDRDGKLDIVTSGMGGLVGFRGAGDGTFRYAATWAGNTGPYILVTADWNNDGRADLATINGQVLSLFLHL